MTPFRELAGQLLTIGFEGQECGAELRRLLADTRPGGVIFFQRNIAESAQFRMLVAQVRELLAPSPLFLAVDLEGGLVDRFRELLGPLPAVGDAARAGLGRELGRMAGRELAAFSLNLDFAPVLDFASPDSQEILSSRTAGAAAGEVISFAAAFLGGLAESGVIGCGKHFPGLGGGRIDSHLGLPAIEKSAAALWQEDLLPYRELRAQLPMVMVAHAWYPGLEKDFAAPEPAPVEPRPATLSPAIIGKLLRERIGYQGIVACDDLEMGGALEGRSIEQAAVGAVRAGCELLLVCRHAANVERVHAALVREAESDASFRDLIKIAAGRITAAKQNLLGAARIGAARKGAAVPLDANTLRRELQQLADEVNRRLLPTTKAAGRPPGEV